MNKPSNINDPMRHFEKYISRQSMARFMARYELFKMQQNIKGCIVECGVHHGAGIMSWAKLSSALEPYALDRRVIGFDTFSGFPDIHQADSAGLKVGNDALAKGAFDAGYDVYKELTQLIADYDENRYLNHLQKVFLVKGDANITIPQFVIDHPYLLVSLLFLDFDLYEPTKTALQHFMPRMSKGSIIAFDEVNNPWWPGETQALLEMIDISKYPLQRFNFDPNISYLVL